MAEGDLGDLLDEITPIDFDLEINRIMTEYSQAWQEIDRAASAEGFMSCPAD